MLTVKLMHEDQDAIMILNEAFPSLVGMEMFCPVCSRVLDCRRAVGLDLYIEDKLSRSVICCATCADERDLVGVTKAAVLPYLDRSPQINVTIEVTDGRRLAELLDWRD